MVQIRRSETLWSACSVRVGVAVFHQWRSNRDLAPISAVARIGVSRAFASGREPWGVGSSILGWYPSFHWLREKIRGWTVGHLRKRMGYRRQDPEGHGDFLRVAEI